MSSVHRLILFTLVLCLCPAINRAQDKEASPQQAESSQPTIQTKFDADKNKTTVGFQQLLIKGTETEKLLLTVEATYATQAPKEHPADVIFIFSALNSTAYRYPDINTLIITSDRDRLPPVPLLNLDKRMAETLFVETLGTRMKYDVFTKLAKGKNVQMKFGETSFALTNEHLALLGKLASLLHL